MTIYALSTVEGQSGVAIIRVSGPLSKKVINNLTGKEPKPRLATLVKIKTLKNKIIDEGLVVYFPKKQSFVGAHPTAKKRCCFLSPQSCAHVPCG